MNKILYTIELDKNITVTLEKRVSKQGNEYTCSCLNVGEKSVVISYDSDFFSKVTNIL